MQSHPPIPAVQLRFESWRSESMTAMNVTSARQANVANSPWSPWIGNAGIRCQSVFAAKNVEKEKAIPRALSAFARNG